MSVIKKIILITSFSFASYLSILSQTLSFSEKIELIDQEKKEIEAYTKDQLDISKFFVNGILHTETTTPDAHPYFELNTWADGKLLYGDQLVTISGIKYDILNDHLVYMNIREKDSYPVVLSPVFCHEFYINDHHFRYLNNELPGNSRSSLNPGYYEIIYDGTTKFFVKWEKYSKLDHLDVKLVLKTKKSLYVYHNFCYTKIRNKGKLFKVLKDREKELKDFVEKEEIVFNKENYSESKRILQFYDHKTK